MAECLKNGKACPAFYECKQEGLAANGKGWETIPMGNKAVTIARPGTAREKQRNMQIFCYYCLACPTGRKIENKAQWTGTTPKWCPLGRGPGVEEADGETDQT